MSELVERVARVLCETRRRCGWFFGDGRSKIARPTAADYEQARAAILALREPSEEMLRGFGNGKALRARAKLQWRAMIDAELGEQ